MSSWHHRVLRHVGARTPPEGVRMKGAFSRIATAVITSALLATIAIPVSAAPAAAPSSTGPVLEVFNPVANDYLRRGRHVITGIAYDPTATTGTGVDQVTVFLGDRDGGGNTWYVPGGYLGSATLGQANIKGAANAQFAKAGWSLKTKSLRKGSYTLYVYARSSVTGRESVTQVPIRVDQP
jgi:hypothetical protein